jgi:hypothetical protein
MYVTAQSILHPASSSRSRSLSSSKNLRATMPVPGSGACRQSLLTCEMRHSLMTLSWASMSDAEAVFLAKGK